MSVDTLTLAQRLRAAELPAEAIAAAIGSAVLEGAATKDDLASVKSELKTDISAVKAELKTDISAIKAQLKADIDHVRTSFELKVEQLRTEIERARNQLFVGMLGLAGVVIAAVRFL